MSSWQERSEIREDVVFFKYVSPTLEKTTDEVFIWDLDKTYLDTAIESIGQLLMTALERAFNKKNVPGTKILLQSLSQSWTQRKGQTRFPIYFITASPPQMEERISEKFSIDKLKPFGCFYKDNLRNLTPKRFWRLNKQVGYKVQALLQLRVRLKENIKQICWGDDSESDAIIYNLYSDICSRRLGPQDLRHILKNFLVVAEQIDTILDLQSQIPANDPVEKIYINLAVDTDPDYYLKFGRRTVPTYNTFQVAVDLLQDKRVGIEEVLTVAQDMVHNYGFTPEELQRSFDDLVRRRLVGANGFQEATQFFTDKGLFSKSYKPTIEPAQEVQSAEGRTELEGHYEPWVPDRIDYLRDYR